MRAVALLLVAVGLQAGSFGELTDAQKWYFGVPDHGSAVLNEHRRALATRAEADTELDGEPALGAEDPPAGEPRRGWPVPGLAKLTRHAPLAEREVSHPRQLLPHPTGPPRA